MKRERPPMPRLAVRITVAARQVKATIPDFFATYERVDITKLATRLDWLLWALFESKPRALDHDPALILRPYNPRIKDVASRYTPHAHDPDALVYREKADHQQKTTGRKPGALRTVTTKGSDIGLKAKFARLEGRTKRRPKQKIAQRKNPWPKRKMV